MISLWSLCLLVLSATYTIAADDDMVHKESLLYRSLVNTDKYERFVRPSVNSSEPTTVEIGLSLIQIVNIDEEQQTIEILAWITKKWNDFRLKWNPDEHDGISALRIPHDVLWVPDIVLFNGVFESGESSGFGHAYHALTHVSSDGTVLWIPPARMKATCKINIAKFPFDTQDCTFKFGSWTYSSKEVNTTFYYGNKDVDKSHLSTFTNWKLESSKAVRNDKKYACCPETYPDITYHLELSRARSYYSYILVMPAVVVTLLLPVMFLLPIGCPEKFQLGCTILICLTLFTLLLEFVVPTAHSDVPLIESYYLGNFIIAGVYLGLSALILNLSRLSSPPPSFITKITNICGKCCCIGSDVVQYKAFKVRMQTGTDDNNIMMDPDSGGSVRGRLEWYTIAAVLDRFFFVLSCVISAIILIGMLSHS